MAYAILRIKKLKTAGAIKAVGEHNQRERETLNANPDQPNVTLIGPEIRSVVAPVHEVSEGAASTDKNPESGPMWEAVKARITEADARIRKNGVLACEVFMGASPEFFRPRGGEAGTWDEARLQAWTPAALDWLREEWGEKNVVSAVLHLDETTPHIQAVVVPIDPDSGKMNASRWLDGRKALSEMQDRYGESMQAIGLERGVRGSVAQHTKIRTWYSHLEKPVPIVPEPLVQTPGYLVITPNARTAFAELETARIQNQQEAPIAILETQARARQLAVKQHQETLATNHRLAKLLKEEQEKVRAGRDREAQLHQNVAALHVERDALKREIDGFREVPLQEAARWFEPEELTEAQVRIGKDAEGRDRLFDNKGLVIGSNAIDLMKRVHECATAGEAAGWSHIRQGDVGVRQALVSTTDLWTRVRDTQPGVDEAKDPARGFRQKRFNRASRQVIRRKPKTWDGAQRIFGLMFFKINRKWNAGGGVTYSIFDSLFQVPVTGFHPHQAMANGGKDPMSDLFREWERQEEEARARQVQDEQARSQPLHRGPRR